MELLSLCGFIMRFERICCLMHSLKYCSFLGNRTGSVTDSDRAQVAAEQSEIIFIGTGTSEGIPRVSCLTNPIKTCSVSLNLHKFSVDLAAMASRHEFLNLQPAT